MIKLIHGNAYDLIKEIEDNSVDLILTDPPYDRQDYMKTLTGVQKEIMAKEFARVLKRTGNLVLFCGMYCKWKWYELLTKAGLKYVMELIWCYPNPPTLRFQTRKFVPAYDSILWFAKSDDYYFDNEIPIGLNWMVENCSAGILRGKEHTPEEHMGVTPKPLKIALRFVKRLCPKGGLVLDPFAGFATFAIQRKEVQGC